MATLVTDLETEFTPEVGSFNAQVTGGAAVLQRKNTDEAAWADFQHLHNAAVVVSNPVGGIYRFHAIGIGDPVVQADDDAAEA